MNTSETRCTRCMRLVTRASETPEVCYECDRRDRRHLRAKPITPSADLYPAAGAFRCERCRVVYVRPFPGEVCWDCESAERRRLTLLTQRRRESGIGARHSKFLSWDDLAGPPDYIEAMRKLRAFVETGDGIVALIGGRGGGKTQAACVAVWQTIEGGRAARTQTAALILADLKARFGGGEGEGSAEAGWLLEWATPHLLAVDELGEWVGGEYSQSMLVRLIDERYRACRPTLLVGNVPVADFAAVVGASVASRATESGSGIIEADWPTFRGAAR